MCYNHLKYRPKNAILFYMSIENPFAGQSEEESKNNPAEQTPEGAKTPENVSPESDDMITRAREIAKKKTGKTSVKLEDLGTVLGEAADEKKTEENGNPIQQEKKNPATKFYEDTLTPDALQEEWEKTEESKNRRDKNVRAIFNDTSTPEEIDQLERERGMGIKKGGEMNIDKAIDKAKEVLTQTNEQKGKKFKRKKTAAGTSEDAELRTQPIDKDNATEAGRGKIKEKEVQRGGELKITPKDPEKATTASFEKLFGIKEEELNAIEGYKTLSVGQRRLVLQNMESMAFTRTKAEAAKKYKEDTAHASFFPKIGRSVLKNFYVAKAEKEVAGTIATKEKKGNLELLKDLTKMTNESGIDAHFENDGKFVIDYAGKMENLTEEEKTTVNYFNNAARSLAEGNTRKAGEGLKLDITNNLLENKYSMALSGLMTMKRGKMIKQEKNANQYEIDKSLLLETFKIDKRVRMNQFFSENPDVEKELDQISSKPFWRKALFNTATERGGYTALGYGGRAALTGALGVLAAPAVAAFNVTTTEPAQ